MNEIKKAIDSVILKQVIKVKYKYAPAVCSLPG
ncbi:hypothetical protein Desaci_2882 [Desulfosporosinus acidiphilus SJ4]|uniref:Uncharacterized protein n=1 Tax=Desulfosporosinus acidiphilus (strain DSM 22704 / JCM 16185 / SJ4) TaxID=646529 RepID=I4D7M0_DESAJ|nr:hypothetical protein Desaci_2882 [Desulfosporosinus acidiphilus SJ4]